MAQISSPFSPLTVLIFRLMLLRISLLAPLFFFLPSGPLPLLFLALRVPLRVLFLLLSSLLLSLPLGWFLLGFLGGLRLLLSLPLVSCPLSCRVLCLWLVILLFLLHLSLPRLLSLLRCSVLGWLRGLLRCESCSFGGFGVCSACVFFLVSPL